MALSRPEMLHEMCNSVQFHLYSTKSKQQLRQGAYDNTEKNEVLEHLFMHSSLKVSP